MRWLLLVEDHALFRQTLALLLEWRTGLVSTQYASVAEARRVLDDSEEKPTFAIIDLDLPDEDWIDLLERLREPPVVVLVSDRNLERSALALEAGAHQVLRKGEPIENIMNSVEQLVGGLRPHGPSSG
jgi:DNA-binding NarL/FixJ family response regulator